MHRLEYRYPNGEWEVYGTFPLPIAQRYAADLVFKVPELETQLIEVEE